jgi:hypothetical protein
MFQSVANRFSTGSVFDIVYRTIANGGAKPASVALQIALTSRWP